MPFGRHVAQKDADLTVLDVPAGPAVLHLHARRLAAALGEATLVNHHNGILSAELLQDIGTQVVTYPIGIPDSIGEQALHPVRSGFSGLLG